MNSIRSAPSDTYSKVRAGFDLPVSLLCARLLPRDTYFPSYKERLCKERLDRLKNVKNAD